MVYSSAEYCNLIWLSIINIFTKSILNSSVHCYFWNNQVYTFTLATISMKYCTFVFPTRETTYNKLKLLIFSKIASIVIQNAIRTSKHNPVFNLCFIFRPKDTKLQRTNQNMFNTYLKLINTSRTRI